MGSPESAVMAANVDPSTVTRRNRARQKPKTEDRHVTWKAHINRWSRPVYAGMLRGSIPLSSTTFKQVRPYEICYVDFYVTDDVTTQGLATYERL